MNKKTKRILLGSLVLLTALIIAFPYLLKFFNNEAESIAQIVKPDSKKPITVEVKEVHYQFLEEKIKMSGTLLSNEEVSLKPEGSGILTDIYFEEGDYVEKGQLLAKLNTSLLEANLKKSQSRLKLNLETENRQKILLEKRAISQEEYDIADAELQYIQAEIEQIKAEIEQLKIYAPFSGHIGLRNASVGDFLNSASTKSIATLYDNSPIKLEFGVSSKYISQFGVGSKIYFNVDALPETFEAKIYAVDKKLDEETGTLIARAKADNKQQKLVAGLFAIIDMVTVSHTDAIMIPTGAVIPELNRHKVFVVEDSKAVERTITIGIRTANEVQVLSGLEKGDQLIVKGIDALRSGIKVKPTNLIANTKN